MLCGYIFWTVLSLVYLIFLVLFMLRAAVPHPAKSSRHVIWIPWIAIVSCNILIILLFSHSILSTRSYCITQTMHVANLWFMCNYVHHKQSLLGIVNLTYRLSYRKKYKMKKKVIFLILSLIPSQPACIQIIKEVIYNSYNVHTTD